MAMGTRKGRERQDPLWYDGELAQAPGHPFYARLNAVLETAGVMSDIALPRYSFNRFRQVSQNRLH